MSGPLVGLTPQSAAGTSIRTGGRTLMNDPDMAAVPHTPGANATTLSGFGLGLRTPHYDAFRRGPVPGVDWLEVISENYMVPGGPALDHLDTIRQHTPMVMHGVSLSIGGTDPLDLSYLQQLRQLIDRVEPAWVSDHLCWTGLNGQQLHDLLPLPYTHSTLRHVADRIAQVQDVLRRPLVLENVSSYVAWSADAMPEWEFIAELILHTGCHWLLDVNNVYVSAVNHGFDARTYLQALPATAIRQIHLAGHETTADGFLIDTHDHPVCEEVWQLYRQTIAMFGPVPTMIERDDHIPALDELVRELERARQESRAALIGDARTSPHALEAMA